MSNGVRFSLPLVLVVCVSPLAQAEERTPMSIALERRGFEQIAHRKGVRVFKHKYDNNIRLGADAIVNAPVDEVLKAVMNYEGQAGKIARLSESRVLRRGKNWLTVYQRLNLPVISDRDFTLKVRWGKSGDVRWVTYKALRRGPPERSGVVRVTYHEGSWQLRPIRGGKATRTRFQVSIDMSGWLPKWMARSGSGKEVPELFTAIRKMVSTQRLRSAKCTTNCS